MAYDRYAGFATSHPAMACPTFLEIVAASPLAGITPLRRRLVNYRRLNNRSDLDVATRLFDILDCVEDRLLLGSLYSGSIGFTYLPLTGVQCEAASLARVLPQVARTLRCIPLYEGDQTLTCALTHPESQAMQDQLHVAAGRPIRSVFAFPQEIDSCIARHYGRPAAPTGNQC